MIISERVRALMEKRGLSQSELARRISITQAAVYKIVSNNPGGSSHLHKIARELGTTPAYLTGDTDDATEGASPTPTPQVLADQLDLVMINEVDLAYGMGGGTVMIETADKRQVAFPRRWLQAITDTSPEHLYFARGDGDSMMPTMMDGDLVMIDRSQRLITRQDKIWAVAFGELGAIKRVRRMAKGGWKLMSDNELVSDELLSDDELFVVGRVIWISRKF